MPRKAKQKVEAVSMDDLTVHIRKICRQEIRKAAQMKSSVIGFEPPEPPADTDEYWGEPLERR